MQYGCERYPEQIWNLYVSDPLRMRIDGDHRPDERGQDENDICRGQKVVLQAELQIGEGKIKNKIEQERQDRAKRDFLAKGHEKNFAE